jgi:membrane-bound serine protease (ClpP class)
MKILMSLLGLILILSVNSFAADVQSSDVHSKCTLEIKIEGIIGSGVSDYIDRAVLKAKKSECSSILAIINTPGGDLESTRMIVEKILNSEIPFLCVVAPQGAHAGSAGAIILQACHVNGALKATNIGAATPITGNGQDIPQDLRKKMINDTVSWLEGMTKLRGRNLEFSKKIVDEAKAVSSEEAYKIKAIDVLSEDVKGFLAKAQGMKTTINQKEHVVTVGAIEVYKPDSRFYILQMFSDPQLAYLLFMGSLALLYFEFTHPGMIAPGVIGAIGLVLSLVSFHKLDVWWGGLALMILGVVFLIAEVFVTSFGALGIGGIIAFVLGGLFLFDPSHTAYSLPLLTIIPTVLVFGGLMLAVGYLMMKTRKLKVQTGSEEMLGKKAQVKNLESSRSGNIKLHGELWKFESLDDLTPHDQIIVVGVDGLTLKVKKN